MKKNKLQLILLSIVSVWLLIVLFAWYLNLNVFGMNALTDVAKIIIVFAAIGMFILTLDFLGYFKQDTTLVEIVTKQSTSTKQKELFVPLSHFVSFEERTRYQPFDKVDNGFYLELTESNAITYHVVDVQNEQLPDVLQENNTFVSIDEKEKQQLDLTTQDAFDTLSYAPGSYQEAGYYVEIDSDHNIVDNIKYTDRRLPPTTEKGHRWIRIATQKARYQGDLELTMELPSVFIENLSDRKRYKSLDDAINGHYLEITSDNASTDRILNVVDEKLPKALVEDNQFIQINDQEKQMISNKALDPALFEKYTPGSYTSPGYYIEVDIDNAFVDNIKHTERRLPPTTAKGHRWVHFNPRKIES